MTPQTLTANQTLSKELHDVCVEKGIEMPESYFWWKVSNGTLERKSGIKVPTELKTGDIPVRKYLGTWSAFPAYTTGELGVWLSGLDKEYITTFKDSQWTCETFEAKAWYEDGGNYPPNAPYADEETEADARCKMLTHLIRTGIITKV